MDYSIANHPCIKQAGPLMTIDGYLSLSDMHIFI
jgi:hypothetical protein